MVLHRRAHVVTAPALPALPLADWRATKETLQRYLQMVGKRKMELSPPEPEWAHVTLFVTSRGLIRYVVTEYGVAYLHGKSIRERAKALIEIAHPKFREELYQYCEQTKWLQRPPLRQAATTR